MNYVDSYFNDDLALSELKKVADKYMDYLKENKKCFNNETYDYLTKITLHDCKIKELKIFERLNLENNDYLSVNLKIIFQNSYDNNYYQLSYHNVHSIDLNTLIEIGYGIEDILVDEIVISNNKINHVIGFVGNISWKIECEELLIEHISYNSDFLSSD